MSFFQTPVEWASLGFDPIALQIGPLALRWYSLAYIAGIVAAWALLLRMVQRSGAPMTKAHVDDLISWATLGVIVGGRLGYVIFYDPAKFLADPLAILKLWEGGMAFHGGLAGVIVALLLFARANGLSSIRILDYVAVVTPVGLGLGRMANFVNGELWGRPTDGTWGIIFADAGLAPRHPSTLYQAFVEGLVLFTVLNLLFWLTNARMKPGLLGGLFIALYGVFRFIVEFFREPDAQLGILSFGLTMGQMLSLPMVAAGLVLMATAGRREAGIRLPKAA